MSRVYFIKPVGMDGPIKIGCSVSPDSRRKTLANWSPFALEIIAEINGDFGIERQFHARFQADHQRREWFNPSPDLYDVIAQIQRGEFDVSTLPPPVNVTANRAASSASHKASWTPERRLLASYSARVRATQTRTLMVSPVFYTGAKDPADRARIDAYLADPYRHGEPLDAYEKRTGYLPYWARRLRLTRPQVAA